MPSALSLQAICLILCINCWNSWQAAYHKHQRALTAPGWNYRGIYSPHQTVSWIGHCTHKSPPLKTTSRLLINRNSKVNLLWEAGPHQDHRLSWHSARTLLLHHQIPGQVSASNAPPLRSSSAPSYLFCWSQSSPDSRWKHFSDSLHGLKPCACWLCCCLLIISPEELRYSPPERDCASADSVCHHTDQRDLCKTWQWDQRAPVAVPPQHSISESPRRLGMLNFTQKTQTPPNQKPNKKPWQGQHLPFTRLSPSALLWPFPGAKGPNTGGNKALTAWPSMT